MNLNFLLTFVLASSSTSGFAQSFPKADQDLKQVDTYIQQLNDDFAKVPGDLSSKAWVKAKLAHMVDVDQFLRKYFESPLRVPLRPVEEEYLHAQISARSARFDRVNANDLKPLLAKYGWLKISEFGKKAGSDAWLLIQHADHDRALQQSVLKVLETLYLKNETSPQNYAYLFDRVASSFADPTQAKPQRYGTQGKCTGPGTWEPHPGEDPKNLDARRKAVGLPPEAEYFKMFKDICK